MDSDKNKIHVSNLEKKIFKDNQKICDRYYNFFVKKLSNYDNLTLKEISITDDELSKLYDKEIEFWHKLSVYKDANVITVLQFIIGVYTKLYQLLLQNLSTKVDNCYFIYGLNIKQTRSSILCNICIRLGDLYRYLKKKNLAKNYYLKARNINPNNGNCLNQLALLESKKPVTCVYYYVRSHLSIEPSNIALNNINLSVQRFSPINPIIKFLFENNQESMPVKINVENWIFVIIIAIYADNVNKISNYLFEEINFWFKFKRETKDNKKDLNFKYIFQALDILLDYCLNKNSTNLCIDIFEKSLFKIKCLITEYCEKKNYEFDCDLSIALTHDYLLAGTTFLNDVHSKLVFEKKPSQNREDSFKILLIRIYKKLDNVIDLLNEKKKQIKKPAKKIRNVVLQSIFSIK